MHRGDSRPDVDEAGSKAPHVHRRRQRESQAMDPLIRKVLSIKPTEPQKKMKRAKIFLKLKIRARADLAPVHRPRAELAIGGPKEVRVLLLAAKMKTGKLRLNIPKAAGAVAEPFQGNFLKRVLPEVVIKIIEIKITRVTITRESRKIT